MIEEKRWSKDLERQVIESWDKEGIYNFKNSEGKTYSIDTPPPYINAPIHIGHATVYTWMDAIARHKRKMGMNVLFPLGMDRNGLPIEVQAEKEFRMSILSTPRESYIENCKLLLKKYEDTSLESFRMLGISFNSWQVGSSIGSAYETDSDEYRRMTQETFILLYKKGLVYENSMPSNYCIDCHTTISDSEVEYSEGDTVLYHIRFETSNHGQIIVATTRPELLPACKLVLVNPEDDKRRVLKGDTAIVPIFGIKVDIIEHPSVDPSYGSGILMVCSYGDLEDIRTLREKNIPPTYIIGDDGRIHIGGSKYDGMKIKEARKAIVEDLESLGLMEKTENVHHRFPICWRTKTPIEFIASKELYLKQAEFKKQLLKASQDMAFYSDKSRRLLESWINGISIDWVLSRRRYYGTEIPLWYCKTCREVVIPEAGKYYKPWKEKPPVDKCAKCGGNEFEGETRIFDTWFDSSSSQQYISGYLWDKDSFSKNYPVTLRPQGKEIVRSWLYFTLLKSYLLFGKAPFEDVWIHMHVVDEKGDKMSKSVGNVILPKEVLEKFGAESFRAWAFLEGNIAEDDVRCSMDRIAGAGKFLTKLWNIARFISSFEQAEMPAELYATDKWMLSVLSGMLKGVIAFNEEYRFDRTALMLRDVTWNVFADHYIELVKARAYGGESFTKEETDSARYVLHFALKAILNTMSPIFPIITDYLWRNMYSDRSIHLERYPESIEDYGLGDYTEKIASFNSFVWNKKKDEGKSFKDEIKISVPDDLSMFAKDFVALHHMV